MLEDNKLLHNDIILLQLNAPESLSLSKLLGLLFIKPQQNWQM